jgi:hypothetical protein
MRRAYLLIVIPAIVVGIFYFAVFHSLGMAIRPAPFVGAIASFVAALLGVRYFQRRKWKGSGRS